MGYEVHDVDDIEPAPDRPSTMRDIAQSARLETLGLRHYEADSGEDLPIAGMHSHDKQEEAFYVIRGTLTVETPMKTFTVPAGAVFTVEAQHPHRAHNAGDEPLEVLAIGAPSIDDGIDYPSGDPVNNAR